MAASKDLSVYQGIQAMDSPVGFNDIPTDPDTNLSDDELAYKQAKERGELTQDELAYFEYKGFDCENITVIS